MLSFSAYNKIGLIKNASLGNAIGLSTLISIKQRKHGFVKNQFLY